MNRYVNRDDVITAIKNCATEDGVLSLNSPEGKMFLRIATAVGSVQSVDPELEVMDERMKDMLKDSYSDGFADAINCLHEFLKEKLEEFEE